jgi:hypothetical protein
VKIPLHLTDDEIRMLDEILSADDLDCMIEDTADDVRADLSTLQMLRGKVRVALNRLYAKEPGK